MNLLHVISTCTLTKRHHVPPMCRLRSYTRGSWKQSLADWLGALAYPHYAMYRAVDLYQGSHWLETQHCVQYAQATGYTAQLWVLSAGWGLLSEDDRIAPYAATFASTDADSIHRLEWPPEAFSRERARLWWAGINEGLHGASLAYRFNKQISGQHLLFILSKEYYNAIEHELLELVGYDHPLIIVSAGLAKDLNSVHPSLRPCVLPLTEKFKQVDSYLDKTNVSLNARLAAWMVQKYGNALVNDVERLHAELAKQEAALPEIVRKEVVPLTDDEVLTFIGAHYKPQSSSATQLLRVLRSQGKSCEQKRFRDLFIRYKQEHPMQGGLFDD